jgi:hypothetical protein
MQNQVTPARTATPVPHSAARLGFYAAILTPVVTAITFVIAFLTPPISGSFCTEPCIAYPYTDIVSRFPRDYVWMFPAMLLSFLYFTLMVCIHQYASPEKKVFSQIGLSLALVAAFVLIADYFIQVSVIQPSVENGEFDGIAILTQYNPHGIFIALEEIGYLMMSLSFLFMAPVLAGPNRVERTIRWTFIIGFVLMIAALIIITVSYGIAREYRFEIAAISIDWIVLIVAGIPLSVVFRRAMTSVAQAAG